MTNYGGEEFNILSQPSFGVTEKHCQVYQTDYLTGQHSDCVAFQVQFWYIATGLTCCVAEGFKYLCRQLNLSVKRSS